MDKSDWGHNIVGLIVALACGGVQPLFAIMFSDILGNYSIYIKSLKIFESEYLRFLSKTKALMVNSPALITLISKTKSLN